MAMQQPPQWAIDAATEAARKSWCAKDSRGVAAFDERGYCLAAANGPPAPFKCGGGECRAACGKVAGHAEERVLWEWARGFPGSPNPSLLHIKLDVHGRVVPGGGPSCVTCSRTMLMAGARGIWLWLAPEHAGGSELAWRWYEAVEFHTLSLLHPKNNLPVIR